MCGIFGYVGSKNAIKEVYAGLNLLQYRGYDSCGIAYFDGCFNVVKAIGVLKNLDKQISKIYKKPSIAFGHTRWATNGEVNFVNTHPHVSMCGEVTIVHNGIITNCEQIKSELIKKGYIFNSDTDTEVIANLLESLTGDYSTRIKEMQNILKGSYALIIGLENGEIYITKKFSPLNILTNSTGIYISSDLNSLNSGSAYSLLDGDIIKVANREVQPIKCKEFKLLPHTGQTKALKLGKFNHFMIKEINEIPEAIYNTYTNLQNQEIRPIFENTKKVTFIGCGTAYHSCLIGKTYFSKLNLELEESLASNYSVCKKVDSSHLHIIVSQSGETADCIRVAEEIVKFGGKILLITNENNSSLTRICDYCILTHAGKEIAVASTKTYCAQVFTFAYIAKMLEMCGFAYDVKALCNKLKHFISHLNINHLAENLAEIDKMILIGKGRDYLTLQEASLKIREIDYVFTLPMYSGELKHGTLSLINEGTIVLSLNTNKADKSITNAINEISSRSGAVIEMDNFIPKEVDELFLPIYSIIPFQILSYLIAVLNGRNPDMPRNLAKSVTVE